MKFYDQTCLEILYEQVKKEHKISKVVIVNNGNVLLLQRPKTLDWELPGGHVDKGEKMKAGAIREVKEETGHKLNEPVLHLIDTQYSDDAKLKWYRSDEPVKKVKISDEHCGYAWVSKKSIDRYTLSPSTNKIIIISCYP